MFIFGVPVHFLLVHFPIALALAATFFDIRGKLGSRRELHETGYRLTLGAAACAVLAVVTGMQLLGGRTNESSGAMHAAAGLITLLTWIILAALRYSAEARRSEGDIDDTFSNLWLALEVFGALAAIAAAFTGHRFALSLPL